MSGQGPRVKASQAGCGLILAKEPLIVILIKLQTKL